MRTLTESVLNAHYTHKCALACSRHFIALLTVEMILGNIERIQEIIKIMNINGHDSEDSENTALIKASAAGKIFF